MTNGRGTRPGASLVLLLAVAMSAAAGPPGLFPAEPSHQEGRRQRPGQTGTPEPAGHSYRMTDVGALIGIHSPEELAERRRALTRLVFGADAIPRDLRPAEVKEAHRDSRFASITSLRSIDLITHVMDHGIDSKIYYLHGSGKSGTLVVYHSGHEGGFHISIDTIGTFLEAGHDVLGISMPLTGMNSRPVTEIDRVGTIHLSRHGWLMYLDRPLHFFMEPIAVAINHALASRTYTRVAMVGFSGGGWSTTLYAAMDERVRLSYPVAGTIPAYLRADLSGRASFTDEEQEWIPLLKTTNYLEMYVLGAAGEGRRQVQILNQRDPAFPQANAYKSYEAVVSGRVSSLGPGLFRVHVDPLSSGHELSAGSLEHILADLELPGGQGLPPP